MITKEEAIEIAKQAVCEQKGWLSFPDDAVLSRAYFSKRNRWVFEWKHETELFTSEIDRILVWVSETGEVLKIDITWKAPKTPELSPNVIRLIERKSIKLQKVSKTDIKKAIREQVKEIEGIDVTIIEYREIKKEIYVFFIPKEEIKDCYWIGRTDCRIFLIDIDGHIIGELVMPSSKGAATSGHGYGEEHTYRCWCWSYLTDKIKPYFDKWFGDNVYGCAPKVIGGENCDETYPGNEYISLDNHDNSVSNIHTKACFCTAHGSSAWYHFVPYTPESAYTATKQNRMAWGCRNSIEELFDNRSSIRLAFLVHCSGMDQTGVGTIEYYFRGKGKTKNTVVIGLRKTTNYSWGAFHNWLPLFLEDIDNNRNKTIKDAFDDAVDTYPAVGEPDIDCSIHNSTDRDTCEKAGCCWVSETSKCVNCGAHIAFSGDESLTPNQILRSDMCKI